MKERLVGWALERHERGRYYGGGSPPPATSTTTVQQQYSPEEAAMRAKVFSEAERLYKDSKDKVGEYPGAKPVALSADTLKAQEMLRANATGAGTQLGADAAKAASFGLSGDVLNPNSNPYLKMSMDNATRKIDESFMSPTGPLAAIRRDFNYGAGGTGSKEGIAGGLAARSYLNTIGDVTASMGNAAYGQGLDYMKSSMAFAPNAYNLLMQPGMTMSAVGGQNEAYQQELANYEAAKRGWNMNSGWNALSPYASIVTGMSSPGTVSTSTSPTGTANRMAPLGSAMMGASLGSSIMPGWGTAIGGGIGLLSGLFR